MIVSFTKFQRWRCAPFLLWCLFLVVQAGAKCTGSAGSCLSRASGVTCRKLQGCRWSSFDFECSGTAYSCSSFSSESSCSSQGSCSWGGSGSGTTSSNTQLIQADKNDDCSFWANTGECEANPSYMLENCAMSCARVASEGDGKPWVLPVAITSLVFGVVWIGIIILYIRKRKRNEPSSGDTSKEQTATATEMDKPKDKNEKTERAEDDDNV